MCITTVPESQTPFRSTASPFRVTDHFETSALNDPQMTLNPTRSKVHHTDITNVPESQISPRFALQPACSSYHTFYNSPLATMLNVQKKKNKQICQQEAHWP